MVLPVGGRKPGIPDRTGFDLNTEVNALNAAVARAIPDTALSPGQRIAWDDDETPFVQNTKVYSPDMFGGVGDGTTDDATALEAMRDAVEDAGGGVISLLGRRWRSSRSLEFNTTVTIDGSAVGAQPGFTDPKLGTLYFDDDVDGLYFTRFAQMVVLRNLGVYSRGNDNGATTGEGVRIEGYRWHMSQVFVRGFAEHGVVYAGQDTDLTNANVGYAYLVHSTRNGGDGFHIVGNNANVITLQTCNAASNDGYGFYNNSAMRNVFIGIHAAYNGIADFWDGSHGSLWLDPYSEGGQFHISDDSHGGILLSGRNTITGAPAVWSGDPPVEGTTYARNRNWFIVQNGDQSQRLGIRNDTGSLSWEFVVDLEGANIMTLRHMPANDKFVSFDVANNRMQVHKNMWLRSTNIQLDTTTGTKIGTATNQKLGFFNATPVVKPTVTGSWADGSAGASLAAALESLGLIDDDTTA